MFALPIFMPARFKSNNFFQNIRKIKLLLQNNAKAFVCWELRPRSPCLQRLRGLPPDPQPPVTSKWRSPAFCIRPPKRPSNCEFQATRLMFLLLLCNLFKLTLRLAAVYGFPPAAPSLNQFANPWHCG